MRKITQHIKIIFISALIAAAGLFVGCVEKKSGQESITILMNEKQVSFSAKNHALDNNDNFSPDGKFLCYDTRGTVFNNNLANCKSIEKIEISTSKETVLWEPEYVTGEEAAPGVAAVSWHPTENKVIFIHGPLLSEVEERGYYGIRNRTGVEVSADGKGVIAKVDMRDVATDRATTPGAQRGGTHRHEYSRNGKRIGFTYDDYLLQNYDRTIGYMEAHKSATKRYTNYFAVLLKTAKKGKSKPGEIEKAYGDSWIDSAGKMRAFVGEVRTENGIDYNTALFVAHIPDDVDITTAIAGNKNEYPLPPQGIVISRLTHSGWVGGIVRGSFDGKRIAYFSKDKKGVQQVFLIDANGSDLSEDKTKQPWQLTNFKSEAFAVRWHPSNNWVFSITNGNIAITNAKMGNDFGKTVMLTNDNKKRSELVVSPDGNSLAYSMFVSNNGNTKDKPSKKYRQIFVLKIDWGKLEKHL